MNGMPTSPTRDYFFAAPLKDKDRWRIIAEVPWETQEQQEESYSSSGDRDPSLEEV